MPVYIQWKCSPGGTRCTLMYNVHILYMKPILFKDYLRKFVKTHLNIYFHYLAKLDKDGKIRIDHSRLGTYLKVKLQNKEVKAQSSIFYKWI